MKINTNLRPEELEVVGKGLYYIAKSQRDGHTFKAKNPAESELMNEVKEAFSSMVESLQNEVDSIE